MAANMFSKEDHLNKGKQPNGSGIGQPPKEHNWWGIGQPPRECKSEVFDVFKKAPSPSGATVSHL